MTALHKYSPFVQLLICIGLYLLCTCVFYGIALFSVLPHVYGITPAAFTDGDFSNPHLLQVMKIFQFGYSICSFFIPALIFFALWHKKPVRYAGLRGRLHVGWALAGIILLVVSLPAVGLLSDLNKLIPFGEEVQALQQRAEAITKAMLNMSDSGDLWFDLLLIAVVPAIAEEFFFRGALQRIFIRLTHRAWIGIAITAVFFSLVHGEMLGFFPRVALGLILGLVYYFSGNLWYAVIVHFFNNGFQVVLVYLFQHHYIAMDPSQDTPTPVALGLVSLIAAIGLFLVYKNKVPVNSDRRMWIHPNNGATDKLIS